VARLVGIDLGTTHTVVASADAARPESDVDVFLVPQLTGPSEVEARPLFDSALYAPLPGEVKVDPWGDAPWVTGELARRRGGEVPGRAVFSAKSWLCHAAVDRTAAILPWGAEAGEGEELLRVSPVDASARLLAHVRRAWDDAHPSEPLAAQEVVLTVPASFDEAARELTLEAAKRAGLSPRLLEEPQAAFYDFLRRGGRAELDALLAAKGRDEALVLVCDVGGGTTDLSLLRATRTGVERVAVGHHLLLGGDNMDLALAFACEGRLGQKLPPSRFGQLVAACRAAKEKLLGDGAPDEVKVSVLGAGSQLVGGTLRTAVTREEADRIVLDGFFPAAPQGARPQRAKSALVAFGLPYERDVAITRHVAWFFARHAGDAAHPDGLLLNGGVFRASRIAARLASAIEAWGGPKLRILPHPDPDLAVARGAVAYALALRGHGTRIEGGAARGYYVGLDATPEGKRRAIAVVPRGAKEGEPHVARSQPLSLVVGRPVRFDLFASDDARVDAPGTVVEIDENDDRFVALPPIAAAFHGGAEAREVRVALEGELTPIGTLELACVELDRDKRYRLAFQLRETKPLADARASETGAAGTQPRASASGSRSTAPPPSLGTRRVEQARELIDRVFGKPRPDAHEREVKDLVRELEKVLGERASWTTPVARALFDALAPLARARRRSADHERVFWMLAGFCVRPGFGDAGDPPRIAQLAPLFAERLAFPAEARSWQQFFIAWRRVAAGLDEAQQLAIRDFADPFIAPPEAGRKRPKKAIPEGAERELLELTAALERVPKERRSELGSWVLERTWTDRDPLLWTVLGRLGARVPAYASVHHVVSPIIAERWLDHLSREKWNEVATASHAAMQLARVTGDRARDVSERVRREVEKRLVAAGAKEEWARAVREYVDVDEAERAAFYGEGLPVGLKLGVLD
jgi:molecular chaperone DnaK (HSP70)